MKYQILLIFVLITTFLHSQSGFTSNKNRDSILFKNIKDLAISLYDKQLKSDKLVWYNGDSKMSVRKNLKKFKRDLNKSEQILDYSFNRRESKSGYIQYSIHFFVKNDNEQHSNIYVGFKPDGLLANHIQIDTEEDLNLWKAEWRRVSDLPPLPLPILNKKKD